MDLRGALKSRGLPRDLNGAYVIGGSPYYMPPMKSSAMDAAELEDLAAKRAAALARYDERPLTLRNICSVR